jgi:hypothetical protein
LPGQCVIIREIAVAEGVFGPGHLGELMQIGHTRISTTLEIYTDTDESARRDALTRLHGLLDQGQG